MLNRKRTNLNGFSLIEMMIAIGLGALLTAGLLSIFISNKASFTAQNGLARLQENGRFASYSLSRDIRMTGFQGCSNNAYIMPVNLIANPDPQLTFEKGKLVEGFQGSNNAWQPTLPTWLTNNLEAGTAILPNTDVLVIRFFDPSAVYLSADMANETDPIQVPSGTAFTSNQIAYITDCEDADFFMVSGTDANGSSVEISHETPENISNNLSKAYQTDSQVGILRVYSFYIKDTGRTNENGQSIFALYRQDIDGNETELAEGIEQIKFLFGVDTTSDGTANTYADANTINNNNQWEEVVSLNVSLLVNTIEEIHHQPQTYSFNNTQTTPNDRLIRRQWDTFITFRNLGLKGNN